MVRISGTLSSGVSLSGRMSGQNTQNGQVNPKAVEQPDRPSLLKDQRPDMTFSGIGRTLDINV
jgi:hypothetical protein